MSATLVPIDSGVAEPKAREQRLQDASRDAEAAVYLSLHESGLLPGRYVAMGAESSRLGPLERLLVCWWDARMHHELFLERRILRLERQLRATLSLDGITDEQRAQVLSHVYGRQGSTRNAHLLQGAECALIDQYRTMDAAARQLVRTLFDRLAGPSEKAPEAGR